jgi:hypothetical protein
MGKLGTWLKDVFGDVRLVMRLELDLAEQRTSFQERLREKDSVITDLRARNESLQSKVERMELVLMPFQSREGRAYADSLQPARPRPPMIAIEPITDWRRYKREFEENATKEYEDARRQQGPAASNGNSGAPAGEALQA